MEEADSADAKTAGIWDCGSSLYDSFELEALERHLASTIASKSYSMPHLSDPTPEPQRPPRKSSKISKSVHHLLRTVFRVGTSAAVHETAPPPPPQQRQRQHLCANEMGRRHRSVRPHGNTAGGLPPEASGKRGVNAAKKDGSAVRKVPSDRHPGAVTVVSRISCH